MPPVQSAGTPTANAPVDPAPAATSVAGVVPTVQDAFSEQPVAAAAKSPASTQAKTVNLSKLFEGIPLGTSWKALPARTRAALEGAATQRMGVYDGEWGPSGLAAKRRELQEHPSAVTEDAFNGYVKSVFENQVPKDFVATRSVTDPALLSALKDLFLAKCAEARSASQFYGGTDKDFNGGPFNEFPLPSATALKAAEGLARRALAKLEKVPDASLDDTGRALKGRLENKLYALVTGSLGGWGVGGEDVLTPYGRANWGSDLMVSSTPGGANVYKGRDEDFLHEASAYWLTPPSVRVNAGTVDATLNFTLPGNAGPDVIASTLGDPKTHPLSKAYTLLTQWYQERLKEDPAAQKPGYGMTPAQQNRMWRSFEADNLIPFHAQPSVTQFKKTLESLISGQTAHYKEMTATVLDVLFPKGDPALTDAQRARVLSAVNKAATFGTLLDATKAALDSATGSPDASARFQKGLDDVGMVGGDTHGAAIKPEDDAQLQTMWQDVKGYIKRHYSDGPVDIASLLQDRMEASTTAGSATSAATGVITAGLEEPRTVVDTYAMMMHEAKHSIDVRSGRAQKVEGSAWEGAAKLIESRVVPKFLEELYAKDPAKAALNKLALIKSDARYGARTEATLAALSAPPGTDSLQLARDIAAKWGLTPALAETLIQRAFNGLQYANYLSGMAQYGDVVDYLQKEVKPKNGVQIDPYLLQEYGLETAGKDAATVDALKGLLAK